MIAVPPLQSPNCVPSAEQVRLDPEHAVPAPPAAGAPLGEAEPEPVELVPETGGELGAEPEAPAEGEAGDASGDAGAAALGEAAADGEEPPAAADGEAPPPAAAALGEGEARMVAVEGVAVEPLGTAAAVELEAVELDEAGEEDAPAPPARLMFGSWGQVPVGGVRVPLPAFWTTEPGFGNWRSAESTVLQPFPTFATNICGNALSRLPKAEPPSVSYAVSLMESRFLLPPLTVMGAQFMYISRLPILLNHVHARV